jgi:hypothetical protein
MKYLLSGLFFLLSFSFATSQNILDYKEYYVGTGYSVGFRNFGKLNQVLQKYNDNKVQETAFGDWRAPNGIAFLVGTTQSFFNVEAGFSQMQQRKKTTFNDNDDLYRRDARLRINSYYIGVGVFFPVTNSFGFGLNASGDYYRMKLSTREALEKSINRSSFISPVTETSYGTTFEAKFYFGQMNYHGTRFMIKPYYSLIFSDLNGALFDESINGVGASADTDSRQRMSHFGLKFVITYAVIK